MPRVHRHVFERMKTVMGVGTLGKSEREGKEEVSLSRIRRARSRGPQVVCRRHKLPIIINWYVWSFPREVVLSFHQIFKEHIPSRLRNYCLSFDERLKTCCTKCDFRSCSNSGGKNGSG